MIHRSRMILLLFPQKIGPSSKSLPFGTDSRFIQSKINETKAWQKNKLSSLNLIELAGFLERSVFASESKGDRCEKQSV